jgi:sec-independent protein translocase protein TatC
MSQEESSQRMSFFDHLDELRVRIMRCLVVFFAGFCGTYFISEHILGILRRPLFEILPPDQQRLYFTSLFENFLTHLKIAGYSSIFIFSPYFFYQLWGFIAPGLYPRERKLVIPFVAAATVFFIGGACFAYFVLFPVGFKFFVTYGGPADFPMLTIDSYYSTCLKLLLLFGIAFELPVLVCLLGILGVVDAPMLRKHRSSAIIGITILAALFAPPDAISMLILGVPMVLMFEASIFVVQWIGNRRSASRKVPPEENSSLEGRSSPL